MVSKKSKPDFTPAKEEFEEFTSIRLIKSTKVPRSASVTILAHPIPSNALMVQPSTLKVRASHPVPILPTDVTI